MLMFAIAAQPNMAMKSSRTSEDVLLTQVRI